MWGVKCLEMGHSGFSSCFAEKERTTFLLLKRRIQLPPALPDFLQADRAATGGWGGGRANGDGWAPTPSLFLVRGSRAGGGWTWNQRDAASQRQHEAALLYTGGCFCLPSLGVKHSRSTCKQALLTGKEKSPTLSSLGSLSSDSTILAVGWKYLCIQNSAQQGKRKKKQKQNQAGKVTDLFIACTRIQNLSHCPYTYPWTIRFFVILAVSPTLNYIYLWHIDFLYRAMPSVSSDIKKVWILNGS